VNARDKNGSTPLHRAAYWYVPHSAWPSPFDTQRESRPCYGSCVDYIRDIIPPHVTQSHVLRRSDRGFKDVVTTLLEAGADPAIQDNLNHTPFGMAVWFGK
jgi:ankyrin repeat protein